jgi:hypothetical protein
MQVEEWVTEVTPSLSVMDRQQRYQTLGHGIHELITSWAISASQSIDNEENQKGPNPQQSETQCRIQIEHCRARLRQLRARIQNKEQVPATHAKAKAWAEARLLRDQLLAIPSSCAAVDALRKESVSCLTRQSAGYGGEQLRLMDTHNYRLGRTYRIESRGAIPETGSTNCRS